MTTPKPVTPAFVCILALLWSAAASAGPGVCTNASGADTPRPWTGQGVLTRWHAPCVWSEEQRALALVPAPTRSATARERAIRDVITPIFRATLTLVVAVLVVFLLRHLLFSFNRMFGRQRHPYLDIDTADWPQVAVLVPCHNESAVVERALGALVEVDYPEGRLRVIPIDDRSSDDTRERILAFAQRHPDVVFPYLRDAGMPGKSAVLSEVSPMLEAEVLIVFDADYIPGRGLIKQLVAPFFDPEVGAVMGRVVPHNTGHNLLTRLLDLERAAGYQVDQQARMNLGLIPLYGGTVGGVRRSALETVGGWDPLALAEDTDITFRLLLAGYKTVYQNRSECYEEVPETWPSRNRQIMRWARGHNQVFFRALLPVAASRRLNWKERLDGLALLSVYLLAPLMLVGAVAAIGLYYLGSEYLSTTWLAIAGMVAFNCLGNFAAFHQVAAAVQLDQGGRRIRLLPFALLSFVSNLVSITRSTYHQLRQDGNGRRRPPDWHKTERSGDPR